MTHHEFARAFKAARRARGLSQSRAAQLLSVTAVTVWLWEKGRTMPWTPELTLQALERSSVERPGARGAA